MVAPLPARKPGRSDDRAEFLTISRETASGWHDGTIHDQDEKCFVRHVPPAVDAMATGGHEAESGVVLRMSEYDHEGTSVAAQTVVPRLDQATTDPTALIRRQHRDGSKASPDDSSAVVLECNRAVQNVTDDVLVSGRNERQQDSAVRSQRIDELTLLRLTEGLLIDCANALDVCRIFVADEHGWMVERGQGAEGRG